LGIVALALAGAWMGLAAWRAPAEFLGWWREVVPWARRDINWLSAADQQVRGLVWVTWPCWPLALWALYAWRGEWRITRLDGLALAAALLCILPVFVGEPRESAGLIALPPLALLATAGLERLRRGAANAFDWFGVMSLSFAAALVWLGWVAQIFEVPARIALNFGKLAPGFEAPWRPFAVIVAVAVSAAWLWLLRSGERSIYRGIVRWSAGVTVVWVLLVSLWMPWIDYTKTYRNPFGALHAAAPRTECVAGDRLGAPQRAMLHYFAGVVTRSPQQRPRCNWMLVKDDPRGPVVAPRGDWVEVWRGGRPGDRAEVYRLYQRDQCAAAKRKHRGSAETAPNCVPPQPVRRR
jgi:4-amino-4-deoxy-L-arabinose transferase-like glycosyltransferase